MITRDELVEVGQFNKPHGVQGEISATLDYDLEDIADIDCIVAEVDGIFVPFFIENRRQKTSSTILLTIDGLTTDTAVKFLVNKEIYCLKSEFVDEELDESDDELTDLPIDYFIGFSAVADDGVQLGEIVDVDDTTENVLFVVERPDGSELQIPAVDEFIAEVDTKQKVLVLSLPDGLLDI